MGKLIDIILVGALILLSFQAYNLYQTLPREAEELRISFKQEIPLAENTSSDLMQFVPNMRFAHNNLSYYFQEDCSNNQTNSMLRAFEILSNKTGILSFYQIENLQNDTDILILCSKEEREVESNKENYKTFIAGEGGPRKFINLSPYSLIIQGEIQLYSSKYIIQCKEPLVELHELLHVFGYAHLDDKTSILYPYLSCDQELKQNIVDDLIRLYSEEPKSEILIENVSAVKAGRYLSFYIEVRNNGIIDAKDVFLDIVADENIIKTVEIGDLDPGLLRLLEMQNVKLPSTRTENIAFKVRTSSPEYFKENNIILMEIKD